MKADKQLNRGWQCVTAWPRSAAAEEQQAEAPPVDLTHVTRALSIRQPYAEQIMRGTKRVEDRTQPTKLRERVYIYASLTPGDEREFKRMKAQPGDFPVGVLVGTVELVDCTGQPGDYEWHLRHPVRLPEPIRPTRHPQPAWFFPFEKSV
jgi:hypothetical protein